MGKERAIAKYVRNFVFGVEDSLVSTVGLISGVAVAGAPKEEIFLVGVVLIFVEATSMGVGSYLSEAFSDDYLSHGKSKNGDQTILAATIMWMSYFITGFIPLSPYIILEIEKAFIISIALSLLSLFLLGYFGAKFFKLSVWKNGIKMLLLGGVAILVGVLVGNAIK